VVDVEIYIAPRSVVGGSLPDDLDVFVQAELPEVRTCQIGSYGQYLRIQLCYRK
jgi:hypothetical protein